MVSELPTSPFKAAHRQPGGHFSVGHAAAAAQHYGGAEMSLLLVSLGC